MYERFKRHILCFELNTVKNYAFLERAFSKRPETKTTFAPWPSCSESEKNEEKMGGRTSEMCMQVGRK